VAGETVSTAVYRVNVEGEDQVRGLADAINRLGVAEDAIVSKSAAVTVAEQKVVATRATSTGQLQGIISRYDALAAAQARYEKDLATIQRAEEGLIGTEAQRAQALQLATQRFSETSAALQKSGAANDNYSAAANRAGISAGQMRFAVQNLGFQVNDLATSLASGSSPFRVLAQQGGQIVQAFGEGGGAGNVLSAFGASIKSLIANDCRGRRSCRGRRGNSPGCVACRR
jgi:hypothetical protein